MSSCCGAPGYRRVFGPRFARRLARRYRRRGLDRASRRVVEFLAAQGVEGASVLEIGGGVGGIQLELLRRGAARTTNLELVDSYEAEAAELAAAAGVSGRVVRMQLDIATDPEAVAPHDVVVLHRVVCCYPDHERLLGAAADRATRLLVFSHPPGHRLLRALAALENLGLRAAGTPFRTYVHSPAAMLAVLQEHGLRPVHADRGAVWQVVGLRR
ncbi:methyltransferase domain-containing protein [Kocuria rosea]|uniref:methyltransferase domain-containing protein n=1 Tax=Kocuria rosea TaxID=1275 RepID=UPI000F6C1C89|nr:methyltransferase domain-containing protein [Kocuria rosea]MEB2527060.1 methyltransferase domain-containing protein [Kocuria rosea]MEB2620079.1 methyltransferase domain-containing protein [Kocuria rosea]VEI49543.1 Multifunctional cyclase-dehydratase-3-O-methyl transferase tcmN [Kocuria rosea]